jgi:hypothetical protein
MLRQLNCQIFQALALLSPSWVFTKILNNEKKRMMGKKTSVQRALDEKRVNLLAVSTRLREKH